ncbi:hypothetical protein [Streptomyces sp. CoH27]|uniref:hypothetical protein n=1 Tax=Streptomyces sp. CoH27 TaxID=2875763 RepID=UPI001CD43BFC|nr:hypothetical protein [Streptomyces sp. CoH27]
MSMPPAPQSPYQTPLSPWGAPLPAPPEKSRVGLMAGIIGGVLLLIVALLATLVLVGKKIENGLPRAEYALTVPRAVLDGDDELTRDESATLGRAMKRSWSRSWDAEAVHGLVARYRPVSGDRGELTVAAMYGRFRDIAGVRARVLAGNRARATQVKVLVPPQDVTPSGSRVRVDCEVLTRTWADGAKLTYPVCAWADGNTWGRVAYMTLDTALNVDLKNEARTTLRIRSAMVRPIR